VRELLRNPEVAAGLAGLVVVSVCGAVAAVKSWRLLGTLAHAFAAMRREDAADLPPVWDADAETETPGVRGSRLVGEESRRADTCAHAHRELVTFAFLGAARDGTASAATRS
jgi:hypothetical protein